MPLVVPASSARPNNLTVDIADYKVSADPSAVLVTYALGSCIGVLVHDPVRRIGGLIHFMLPLSSANPQKARLRPAMFADTGVPALFESLYALGARKEDLVVRAAGGSNLHDTQGMFNIGKRNYTVLRKLLWKNHILIASEDVGGCRSRTVRLYVGSGEATVSSQGQEVPL
ncbi:MAG: chemotaxis protein CheD [Myxococcales bacterium]|nr:chemotaxis protein CheD [Myxococcales bacterium]